MWQDRSAPDASSQDNRAPPFIMSLLLGWPGSLQGPPVASDERKRQQLRRTADSLPVARGETAASLQPDSERQEREETFRKHQVTNC